MTAHDLTLPGARAAIDTLAVALADALDAAEDAGATFVEVLAAAITVVAADREVLPDPDDPAVMGSGALVAAAGLFLETASEISIRQRAERLGHAAVWQRTYATCRCGWGPRPGISVRVVDHLRDVVEAAR